MRFFKQIEIETFIFHPHQFHWHVKIPKCKNLQEISVKEGSCMILDVNENLNKS